MGWLVADMTERPQAASAVTMARRRSLLVVGAALMLGACGFKLRQAPEFAFRTLYINAGSTLPLAAELRRAIESAGKVTVLTAPGEMARADVVLELLANPQDRVVVAQSSAGQVQEFTLRMSVKFNLHTPAGRELIPETELMQQRDVSFNESLALAKMSEESLLLRSMQSELVQLMMIRLAAVREI
jgi:LPS-assembly lipoprotein